MKTLTLLRHAKSGWDDPALRDFDRPLNAKGMRAAQTVGRAMRDAGMTFGRVIASPATRVMQTLDGVESGYGARLSAAWERRLYLAPAATLLDIVREQTDDADSLLLVAHNPGLEELVLWLVPEGELREAVATKYPTASLAVIEFDGSDWGAINPGEGRLARFIRPRDLDPSLGPEFA
jgi:phosphohistidine phosphatase